MGTGNDVTTQEPADQAEEQGQETTSKAGRPPPIVLTSTVNPMSLQKELNVLLKGSFEFRNTKAGTRIVSKEMADYSATRHYLDCQHLNYFTFFPKSEKPIKAVIRHLLADTPAEDISNALVELGFDIISVKQMTSRKTIRDGGTRVTNLPLFLVTLPRTENSKNIFKLSNLCNILTEDYVEITH
jgi:hypothetical protein